MESAHHFSSRPDCNNTADVPSFTLRAALSAIPSCFRSVWCRRKMIPRKIFPGFGKFLGIVSVNDFWLPIWPQELLQASSVFPEIFVLHASPAPRLHVDDCFEIHNLH